jgi:hypothetical protein
MKNYPGLLVLIAAVFLMSCSTVTYSTFAVTENPVGTKIGQIEQTKGGTLEAARNGGITSISTVSKQVTEYYMIWPLPLQRVPLGYRYDIIVTGE